MMTYNEGGTKPTNNSSGTMMNMIGEAATWTWDFIKVPFTQKSQASLSIKYDY